jgi:4-hydroxyphenylacetate 3-monooxygenase
MPARSGQQYLDGLRRQKREIWLGGTRVEDVTTHPGLASGARAIASLYDMQLDPSLKAEMTYTSPTSGDPVGLSFIIPKTRDDLVRRREMMLRWARATCGMMGRSPDFMNVSFAAWAAAAGYFARGRPEFGENMRRYYEHIRENDLVLTHALINLQRSRSATGLYNLEDGTALRVMRETSAGIVVRGARVLATLGAYADEIAVYSPRLGLHTGADNPFALSFAIPCATEGLRFLCRDSYDLGRSHFDHPLGSRFEEMDCIVFFDDVLVPWERVFLLGDVGLLNNLGPGTNYSAHSAHQGAVKNLAKCEFILGLALLMVETLGSGKAPQVEAMIGELMLHTTTTKALMRAAEADAKIDEWGVMCPDAVMVESTRNLFVTVYPRLVEIVQLLGSSSFMIAPSEADMEGPLKSQIDQYLATDGASARDRVKLFRLASDVAINAFGSRQVLYERFYAGDPLSRARALAGIYAKGETMERVRAFLADEGA